MSSRLKLARRFAELEPPSVVWHVTDGEVKSSPDAAEALEDTVDGEISLSTAFRPGIHLSVPGSSERISLPLEFCVSDNGPGVNEELRAYLFDPFVTSKSHGSGLGLALVAKIVGDHGGVIECDSQPRKTTFRVLLPAWREEEIKASISTPSEES